MFRVVVLLLLITVAVSGVFSVLVWMRASRLRNLREEAKASAGEFERLTSLHRNLAEAVQIKAELEQIWKGQSAWAPFAARVFEGSPSDSMVGKLEWSREEEDDRDSKKAEVVPMRYYMGQVAGRAVGSEPDKLVFQFLERLKESPEVTDLFPKLSLQGMQRLAETDESTEARSTFAISFTGVSRPLYPEETTEP
jgi:hypothetical protein